MLVAGIKSRAERIRVAPDLPTAENRETLAAALCAFATSLMQERTHPIVIAVYRLAIAEAARSPEIAETLDHSGRSVARNLLAELLAKAQARGLIGVGEPTEMASQFCGLLWEELMVELLLGVAATPEVREIERRAQKATNAFLRLYPDPAAGG
jgi:hypothetical protein